MLLPQNNFKPFKRLNRLYVFFKIILIIRIYNITVTYKKESMSQVYLLAVGHSNYVINAM